MSQSAPRLTVLTVSKHARLARLLEEEINTRGHTSIIAESEEEALAMAGATLLDIVLLDFEAGGGDALEIARKLPSIRGMAMLMLVSSAEEINQARAAGAGIRGYLLKPFTTQRFWSGIWDALAAHSRSRPNIEVVPDIDRAEEWRNGSDSMAAFDELLDTSREDAATKDLRVAV